MTVTGGKRGGSRGGGRLIAVFLVALMVGSAAATGVVAGVEREDASESAAGEQVEGEMEALDVPELAVDGNWSPTRRGGGTLTDEQRAAVEKGVERAASLAREQGAEVNAAQVEAATQGALSAASDWAAADEEQLQSAAIGAAHGAFVQKQVTNVTQIQVAVGGAAGGALSQYQRVTATQVQAAAYGAAHGSLAQRQTVTMEQLQFAATGSAAGAAAGAARERTAGIGTIREAAQGAAYGSLERKRATAEQMAFASRGGALGAIVQHQQANVKQVQVAAMGGAKGALVQRQSVTVEQIQYAAIGGSSGALVQIQRVTVEQIQVAAHGAAAGAITRVVQRQEIRVEQVQAAARGSAAGVLAQRQTVTVEQLQAAARGAAGGAVLQYQEVTVEQMQSAAYGAAQGALFQRQTVSVEQVQYAAQGAAEGSLLQAQAVRVEQVQAAASGAASGVVSQRQTVSVEQAQHAARGAASGAVGQVVQRQEIRVEQVQAAASGAASGVLAQRQTIRVEQVQAAASGAAGGALTQYQSVTVEQIQVAARGAAKGSASAAVQRQTVTIEQVQAAASGAAEGSLTQIQRVSISQVQYAAQGAAEGALVQRQRVTVEQVQAAARGAASGGVQVQRVTVVQVQVATRSAASGALSQSQRVTVTQIQGAANGACRGVLRQVQRISITQIQYLTWETAARSAFEASQTDVEDPEQVSNAAANRSDESVEQPDRPTASVSLADQEVEGQTVTVESATLSEGGFVVVRNESYDDGDVLGSVVGVSDYLEPGEHENVTVELDAALDGNQTVIAVAHQDTNDDQSFDFLASDGIEDGAYVDEGGPVLDRGSVTVPVERVTANVTIREQSTNGTAIVVSSANLSNGGFVGVHSADFDYRNPAESLLDASGYLEPGEHENVTVTLDEPLTESGPVFVVAYRDTDDDRTFDFLASGGEDDGPYSANGTPVFETADVTVGNVTPNAAISVADQSGDGTNLSVENASATVEYFVTASADDETRNETVTLAANETFAGNLTLEPALTENATVTVAVRNAETGGAIVADTLNYTVEETPEPPASATLDVADQSGDGSNLAVESASGTVNFTLAVERDDETLNETAFDANETFAGNLTLEPSLAENATVSVTVLDNETGEELAAEDVNYTVEEAPEPPANATLDVSDQTGNGTNLTVENASATVAYRIEASADGETLNETDAFDAGESFGGNLTLEPPLAENATVSVTVLDNGTGEELAAEDVNYTVTNETGVEPAPNATLTVLDQTGNGTNLSVENASATVDHRIEASTDDETLNETRAFDANRTFAGNLTLEPSLAENATVTVAVLDAETGDELAAESVNYTVEAEPEPPEVTLDMADQTGNGANLSVENASAGQPFYLAVERDGETLNETDAFDAGVAFEDGLALALDPVVGENATLNVSVRDAETGEVLVAADVNYTAALTQDTVDAISRYEDVDVAIRDGYEDTHRFAMDGDRGVGIRFVNSALLTDDERSPRQPATLLYTIDGDTGEYELVGVEWAVAETAADGTPALFDRDFDGPVPGHVEAMPSHYELYGWLFVENADGAFAASNPTLEPPELIDASDQTGNGSVVTVNRAVFGGVAYDEVGDEYYVEVRSADGTVLGRSDALTGEATDVTVELDQPLTETATVTLALHHADTGAEIAEPVARENVTVTVEAATTTTITTTPTTTTTTPTTTTTATTTTTTTTTTEDASGANASGANESGANSSDVDAAAAADTDASSGGGGDGVWLLALVGSAAAVTLGARREK
jgi:hypothetical protein